jgi:predicted kinase
MLMAKTTSELLLVFMRTMTPKSSSATPRRAARGLLTGMTKLHLLIVCGIPGAGKSTLARRVVERWGGVSFASETFAAQLGDAARTASGDLSKQAIVHAYAAMGTAAAAALALNKLVSVVGSFRSVEQRRRFWDLGIAAGAKVTKLRLVCPLATAAERIRSRFATGERGPGELAILHIETELNQASDMDVVLRNDSSIERLHRQVDAMIELLQSDSSIAAIKQRIERLAKEEPPVARDFDRTTCN